MILRSSHQSALKLTKRIMAITAEIADTPLLTGFQTSLSFTGMTRGGEAEVSIFLKEISIDC